MAGPTTSHSSNDQLYIPLVVGSLPQEQACGAQGQIPVCVRDTHTHDLPLKDSPVSIAQGIQSVLGGHMAWWDVGDHAGFGIADERVLENLCEQKAGQWNQLRKGTLTTYCVQDTGPQSPRLQKGNS